MACVGGAGLLVLLALGATACEDDGSGGEGGGTTTTTTTTTTAQGGGGGQGGQGGQGGGMALPPGCDVLLTAGADDQTAVQTALIQAAPNSTVCFSAGTFTFTTELSLDVQGVTLRGAGAAETVFDFSNQDTGGNGLLIRSDGCAVEMLQILNTPGDGIRGDAVAGIAFRDMAVMWDADASVDNGAYGLYPVGSTDVVIERCVVKGARDAGIYVGQSTGIQVVDSEVYGNVAGIEIENSTDALVRGNHAHDNTAGVLVFNLPGLPVQDGKRANVFENLLENNNLANFAAQGTMVAMVPPGVGVFVLASDDNEIHGNTIQGNVSAPVVVFSYNEMLFGPVNDPTYDFWPQGNYTHDNTYTNNGTDPQGIIGLLTAIRPVPDVLWDGCTDAMAVDDGHLINCVMEAGTTTYLNFNQCNELPAASQDVTPVTCMYDPLPTQ